MMKIEEITKQEAQRQCCACNKKQAKWAITVEAEGENPRAIRGYRMALCDQCKKDWEASISEMAQPTKEEMDEAMEQIKQELKIAILETALLNCSHRVLTLINRLSIFVSPRQLDDIGIGTDIQSAGDLAKKEIDWAKEEIEGGIS